ncbi:MAG TPA: hypothetical protein ENK85_04870 [Saprospiraceae bacterium]|nr:hypothetical protein [Saprospiraceae bacterium]
MKKNILLLWAILSVSVLFAQKGDQPVTDINVISRFKDGNIELRFFPDQKKAMFDGIEYGFIIKRAILTEGLKEESQLQYKVIAQTKGLAPKAWDKTLKKATGETKDLLELAKDFYDQRNQQTGGNFSLDEGIQDLKNQKAKENFEYVIFAMSAIKDAKVAEALGVAYTDRDVQAGATYLYKVELVKNTSIYQINPIFSMIEAKQQNFSERDLWIKEGDTKLSFFWKEEDMVSGVLAERKDLKTGQWVPLNKALQLNLGKQGINSFVDTGLVNYQEYEYRFYGQSPFGEKVLFGHAKGTPRDLTPPKSPQLLSGKQINAKEVRLKWDVQLPMDGDLDGFLVGRGKFNKGQFNIISNGILSKDTREFIDTTFVQHQPNYYVIQAIDTAGNKSSSFAYFVTLIDSVPPAKPNFVSGKIDSNGVVTLNIELNKEEDLMGYRLFRANGPEHEFSVVEEGFDPQDTTIHPVKTVFHDTVTLNSLTPYIYYRIRALDYNFNQSEFSDILKVKRLDTIPPVEPVFKNVIVHKDRVELFFAPSGSRDVVSHYLYRKTEKNGTWNIVANIPKGKKNYVDTKVKQGQTYYYSLRAKDDSDLYSDYAFAVSAKPYDDGVRPIVRNLKVAQKDKKMKISWEYPSNYKNAFFVIYRKDKKGRLHQFSKTEENYALVTPKQPKEELAVKAFTRDGGESKISPIVEFSTTQ